MTRSPLRAALAAGAALIALDLAAPPAMAQRIVYDPTNHIQTVLTAARELQQINNQIKSLQNQATSLINQAKNLASLPYSALAQLQQSLQSTQQLLGQAQRIAYSVTAINKAFAGAYPQAYQGSTTQQQMISDANTRWLNARASFQDALHVQAVVVQNLNTAHAQIGALVTSSQQASGALQAAQAGNQLVALQTQQLTDLTAVMAAIARAQSLDGARAAEGQAQAQQQLTNFLTYGSGYQPVIIQLFQ